MYLFSEKNLNWFFTILFVILIIYLITVFIGDFVDRRISNVEVRIPGSYRQFGGVDTLVNVEGTPVGAVATVATVAPVGIGATDLVTPINAIGTLFTAPSSAVATVNPGVAVITPVTAMATYPAVPSAVPIPVVSPAVSTTASVGPAQPIVALPTPAMNTVPLSAVPTPSSLGYPTGPGAAAASALTVQALPGPAPGVAVATVNPVPANLPTVTAVIPTNTPTVAAVNPVATITYYKDPHDMTPEQRRKFKEQATFAKMTLQDYKNWLDLWRDDVNNLTIIFPAHLTNFRKYISGIPLTQSDLTLVVTSVIMPVAVKTPGLDTGQNLYNRFFLGDQYVGQYPEVFATYPNVTTIPLQIASIPQPVVIS